MQQTKNRSRLALVVAATALCGAMSTATLTAQTRVRACPGGSGADVAVLSYCVPETLAEIDLGTGGVGIGDTLCGDPSNRFNSVTFVDADHPSAPGLSGFSCVVVMTGQPFDDLDQPDGQHHCADEFGLTADRSSMDAAGPILATFASGTGGVLLTGPSLGPDDQTGVGTTAQDGAGTSILSPGHSPYARASAVSLITGGAMDINDLDSGAAGNQVHPVCESVLTAGLIAETDIYTNNRAFRVGALDSANMALECATFPDAGVPSGAVALNLDETVAVFPASTVDLGGGGETSDPEFQNILRNSLGVICAGDTMGPITRNVTATPNPASLNDPITLTALLDDMGAGGSLIVSAEYQIRDSSGIEVKSGSSLDCLSPLDLCAADGVFDEISEDVVVTVEAGSLGFGIYDVCFRGTDFAGNVGDYGQTAPEPACGMLVIYDPNGGFVTGHGSIQSGAESCSICGGASGKATFGFQSKYRRNGQGPEGSTSFKFKDGNLEFTSDATEWLVISGAKAQFKGTGAVNGTPGFEFHIWATDGKDSGVDDSFRIQIKSSGGIVYDNNAEQVITSGNIVVHK